MMSFDTEVDILVISRPETGEVLLRIHADGRTVDGEVENMGEAANVFVNEMRKVISISPIVTN